MFKQIWSFISARKRDLLILFTALFNKNTPKAIKTMTIMAFLYLISPIDFLPDVLPGVGLIDDALIVPSLIYLASHMLPEKVRLNSEKQADFLIPKMPYILAVIGIFLIAWSIFVFVAIYHFIFS